MVHSVIIGISLGTTQSPKIIKPLIAALSFHQFFEGMGLGGCIAQVRLYHSYIYQQIKVIIFPITNLEFLKKKLKKYRQILKHEQQQ